MRRYEHSHWYAAWRRGRATRALASALAVAAAVAALGVTGATAASAASPSTVTYTVNQRNLGLNWSLYTDNGASGSFVTGPATPPLGTGSFAFTVPDNGKVTLSTAIPAGQLLSAVDTVSYATYRDGSSTMPGYVDPSLNIEICAGGIVGTSCEGYTTLVWEPVYAYGTPANGNDPVVDGSWQTWDALGHTSTSYSGGWWSTHAIPGVCAANCFVSLSSIQAANPDAVILSFGVNLGHGPAGTFAGAADALTLGLGGTTTVYDLEPATPANEQCKHGGWTTFTTPSFRNQGACVSYFASSGHGKR